MEKEILSQYYIFLILIPVLCGTLARYLTFIVDYRQYHYNKRDYNTGRIAIVMVPIIYDEGAFIETVINFIQLMAVFLFLNNILNP